MRKDLSEIIQLRRIIHSNPELSGNEFQTSKTVFNYLKNKGLAPKYHAGKTGVSVALGNKKLKPVVLRADMDALPILEATNLPYASKNEGVMHACGHDMHTAALCGAVAVLADKDLVDKHLVFIFQPSEERAPGGAQILIKEKAFPENTRAVIGLHVNSVYETGTIALHEGYDFAGVIDFDISLAGKGGHAATPERSVDLALCVATVTTELRKLTLHEKFKGEQATLSVCTIQTGSSYNVIPSEALIKGTIRAFSKKSLTDLENQLSGIVKKIAAQFKAHAAVSFVYGYPPLYNDPALFDHAKKILTKELGVKNIIDKKEPSLYAEDFAYYGQKAPGIFFHLGVAPKGKTITGIHTPTFCPDEKALGVAIEAHVALALGV